MSHQKVEIRLLGAIMSFALAVSALSGSLWTLSPGTVSSRVAALSSSPTVLSSVWLIMVLMILPYFLMQALHIFQAWARAITRTACYATLGSGIIWFYLGELSRNLDYDYITIVYLINGAAAIGMAAALAFTLNDSKRRRDKGEVAV